MIRIRLGVDERVPVRLAVSPLANLVSALLLVLAGVEREATPLWRRMLAERLGELDAGPLAPLAEPSPAWLPDVLAPVPAPGTSTIGDEIAAIAATPPDAVRAGVAAYPGASLPAALHK